MEDKIAQWEQALCHPRGIKIRTSDRKLYRQQLYRARDMSGRKEEFKGLAVVFPKADPKALYIVHKELGDA